LQQGNSGRQLPASPKFYREANENCDEINYL